MDEKLKQRLSVMSLADLYALDQILLDRDQDVNQNLKLLELTHGVQYEITERINALIAE